MTDLKQETYSVVGILGFCGAVGVSCLVELSMKKFYNLGAWLCYIQINVLRICVHRTIA